MVEKNILCNVCGRRFATRAAREQHARASHGSPPVRPVPKPPARVAVRRNRARGTGIGTNMVAPSLSSPVAGSTITVSGTDRVLMFNVEKGSVVFKKVQIDPDVSSRLRALASAYQRIKYNSVKFVVTPQAAAIVSGGYVAGFIPDPDDDSISAADLSASQGSLTRKWYESAIVTMPRKPDLLYTSEGEEERLVSPGSFWMITEGPPSETTTVVVTIMWTVTLSVPSVHTKSPIVITAADYYPVKGQNYMAFNPEGTNVDFSSLFLKYVPSGDASKSYVFRVPFSFNIEYKEGAGDTGTAQCHFVVYCVADKKLYYSSDGKTKSSYKWQSDLDVQLLIPKGTKLKAEGELGKLGFRLQLSKLTNSMSYCCLCQNNSTK